MTTIINSLSEITELNTQYAHISNPNKWIQINKSADNNFCVYGMVNGDNPTSITGKSNYIKTWKSFKNVLNSLDKFSNDGAWGMKNWKN